MSLTAGCGSQPELVWPRECREAISLSVECHAPEEAAQVLSDTDESVICVAVNPRLAFVESDLSHAEHEVHVPGRQRRRYSHPPQNVLWPAMEAFYKAIKIEGGLKVNRTKTKVYSSNGNYEEKPQEF